MTGRQRIVIAGILLGPLLAVGLAAGGAAWSPRKAIDPESYQAQDRFDDDAVWDERKPDAFGPAPVTRLGVSRGFASEVVVLQAYRPCPEEGVVRMEYATVHRTGWPFIAFTGERWVLAAAECAGFEAERVTMAGLVDLPGEKRALPLRPRWGPLLANASFLGFCTWAVLMGPFSLRGVLRRRRGRCNYCNTPLKDDGSCPACVRGRRRG